MASKITVNVSFSQLAVFHSALQQPFNDWTEKHVAQGFAWRPGSVSFRTLVEAGPHSVEIDVAQDVGALSLGVVRAIEVPFEVPVDGAIEIGSISASVPLFVPPGSFLLRCEFSGPAGDAVGRVRLVFANTNAAHFAVVRADALLSAKGGLLTTAEPALS